MPKSLTPNLLEHVQALLVARPSGLSLAGLESALKEFASRRTLQRRLEEWTQAGDVLATGNRRGRRYHAAFRQPPPRAVSHANARSIAEPTAADGTLPLSDDGRQVMARVNRPLLHRSPAGYQREFLEGYVPNLSAYLPEALRRHLHQLGQTPDGQRPAGTYARNILDRLLIDLSWASSRLEGNTYSLLDTRELIERGTIAAGKDATETQMILNHKAAIELLVSEGDEVGVNRYTLTNLHALLADSLLEDSRNTGRLRRTPVGISSSTYVPTAIPALIEEMFEKTIELASAILDPFEQSFFLMVHIPYLQPFVDVNKRTSRLAANIPLIRKNLVPLSFLDVPEATYVAGLVGVYELCRVELLRDVYVWAYERSVRQYKTVRSSLPAPDLFRLRYRETLIDVVGALIRAKRPTTARAIKALARPLVEANDVGAFVRLVQTEMAELHEGNIARFRVRPGEFREWKKNH